MKNSSSFIFNNLILSYVIFTCNKLNLFPFFEKGTPLPELLDATKFDNDRLRKLIDIAITMDIVQKNEQDELTLTTLGKEVAEYRGFFTWAIGGYSPLLESLETFLQKPETPWMPFVRGKYVAIGSDECNRFLMQNIFDTVMDTIDVQKVADLGCGNAGRLVGWLERQKSLKGVGIDINPQAIQECEKNRTAHHLEDRLELVCENVFTSLTSTSAALKDVELVTSFMMLHDLFNISELNGVLFDKMRAAFPKAKYFVFADTCLDEKQRTAETMPVFTMGYELVHTFRGIRLYPLSYYLEQFQKGGLTVVSQHDFGVPNTYLFVLKV